MSKLNQEESEVLKAFEAGELKSAKDAADIGKKHQRYAEAMLKKDARINSGLGYPRKGYRPDTA